jgi:hypothetical protein
MLDCQEINFKFKKFHLLYRVMLKHLQTFQYPHVKIEFMHVRNEKRKQNFIILNTDSNRHAIDAVEPQY